jgi:peptidoglycan hydrolase CwlO-like protein
MNAQGLEAILVALASILGAIFGFLIKNKNINSKNNKTNLDEFQEEFKRLQARVDLLERKNYELMEKVAILTAENAVLVERLKNYEQRGDNK